MSDTRLAVVTGASTGIGYELARIALENGYHVIGVADEPEIETAAARLRGNGGAVEAVQADLATASGVDVLLGVLAGRQVDVLCANAGRGLQGVWLDQAPEDWSRVLHLNLTGTLHVMHPVLRQMVGRGEGKVLVTGSIAGFMPGSLNAVYNATKAFLDSFTDALRDELREVDGVTITTLMPGPTDTEFFERAGLEGTGMGEGPKDPADEVAQAGWDALMKGEKTRITGAKSKLMAASSTLMPDSAAAASHRKMNEPLDE